MVKQELIAAVAVLALVLMLGNQPIVPVVPITTTTTIPTPTCELICIWDSCPNNHLPDANGCINCASPCPIITTTTTIPMVTSPPIVPGTRYWHDFPIDFQLDVAMACPIPGYAVGLMLSTIPQSCGNDCHCYRDGLDLDIREANYGWGFGGRILDSCASRYTKYDAVGTVTSYRVVMEGGSVDVYRNGVQVIDGFAFDTQGANFKSYYIECDSGVINAFSISAL